METPTKNDEAEKKAKDFLFLLLTDNQKNVLLKDVMEKTSMLPGSRSKLISNGKITLTTGSGDPVT